MPKHTYGGDLIEPAYSLYGSSTCWRGLRDAARLATVMQDRRSATWWAAAAEARGNLHSAAERSYRRDGKPPYLPFRTDDSGPVPSAADYHQLFASLILETALFGWHGRWSHEITDYLEQTGRQVLQVARFDQWFGRLGVDAEYSGHSAMCDSPSRVFTLLPGSARTSGAELRSSYVRVPGNGDRAVQPNRVERSHANAG